METILAHAQGLVYTLAHLMPTAYQSDRLLPSTEEAKRLSALIPKATIHSLPHSGHACLLEPEVNLHDILQSWDDMHTSDRTPALTGGDRTAS